MFETCIFVFTLNHNIGLIPHAKILTNQFFSTGPGVVFTTHTILQGSFPSVCRILCANWWDNTQTSQTMVWHKPKVLKLDYFLSVLQSFDRVHYWDWCRCYCISHWYLSLPLCPQNLVYKHSKPHSRQRKRFSLQNSFEKLTKCTPILQSLDRIQCGG